MEFDPEKYGKQDQSFDPDKYLKSFDANSYLKASEEPKKPVTRVFQALPAAERAEASKEATIGAL